jgi:hypothetical protein
MLVHFFLCTLVAMVAESEIVMSVMSRCLLLFRKERRYVTGSAFIYVDRDDR